MSVCVCDIDRTLLHVGSATVSVELGGGPDLTYLRLYCLHELYVSLHDLHTFTVLCNLSTRGHTYP